MTSNAYNKTSSKNKEESLLTSPPEPVNPIFGKIPWGPTVTILNNGYQADALQLKIQQV